jgi:ABC-2 type transport system permease protein
MCSWILWAGAWKRWNMPEWRAFARTVFARAYPRVVLNVRERWWLFFDVLLPLVALSAYVFVYRAIHAPKEFVGFVILGGAMSAFWLNVLWAMGNQLYWEKETGNLGLYIMSPSSLMAILLGMALGGMFATTLRALAIIAMGSLLFDVTYTVTNVPLLCVVFVSALIALYGMGMMFASLFLLFGREGWHIANLAQEPVYLLSGTYFPLSGFNFWVSACASIIPLTLALDALRQLSFATHEGFLDPRLEAGVLAVLSVIFVFAAYHLLAYMERLAIAEGRLTESRA